MSDVMLLHARKHQGKPPRTPSGWTAPVLVDEKFGVQNTATQLAATATTITLAVGDQLVAKRARASGTESGVWSAGITSTGGGTLTWTKRASVLANSKCEIDIWTSTPLTAAAAVTVSTGNDNIGQQKSLTVEAWRGASLFDGTQRIVQVNGPTTGLPDGAHLLSTQGDNGDVTWLSGDWSAISPAGTVYWSGATAQQVHFVASQYTAYHGRQDAPLAGPQRVGLQAGVSQNWNLVGLEVEGLPSSGGITGTASLAATASLTASGVVGRSSAATGSHTASLTAGGVVGQVVGAALAITATLTASGTVGAAPVDVSSGASLSSTASLTASGARGTATPASVVGTGTLTASGTVGTSGAASLAATATLTASGVVARTSPAALAATATLGAGGSLGTAAGASLAATASLTATGVVASSSAAGLTAAATLTAAGTVTVAGGANANLVATVSLTATGLVAKSTGASLAAVGSATATGTTGKATSSNLVATATLTATGTVTAGLTGTATLAATATLSATGVRRIHRVAPAALDATYIADATGTVSVRTGTTLLASVTIVADGVVTDPTAIVNPHRTIRVRPGRHQQGVGHPRERTTYVLPDDRTTGA